MAMRIALQDDEAILTDLAATIPDIRLRFAEARDEARRQLIAERGDPTPYKLA
jgi:hypothetical protein